MVKRGALSLELWTLLSSMFSPFLYCLVEFLPNNGGVRYFTVAFTLPRCGVFFRYPVLDVV